MWACTQPDRRWHQTLAQAGGCITVPAAAGTPSWKSVRPSHSFRYQLSHADTSRQIDSQNSSCSNRLLEPTILPAQCVTTSRWFTALRAVRSSG